MTIKRNQAAGFTLIALVVLAGMASCTQRAQWVTSEQRAKVVGEIAATDVFRFPTPDPTGSMLAYLHRGEAGRELCLLDLHTLQARSVLLTNEVTKIREWSPDGRYLAFVQSPYLSPMRTGVPAGGKDREAWLTLYDTSRGSVERLTDDQGVIETQFSWLDSNRYLLGRRRLDGDSWEVLAGIRGSDALEKISDRKDFVVMPGGKIAFAKKGEVFLQRLLSSADGDGDGAERDFQTVWQLSGFGTNGFDELRWLNYSAPSRQFLFCARPGNSAWRYLFRFDLQSGQATKLNDEDTYNGQWLERGMGHAYVGNPDNHFYLAVRPADPAAETNLFSQGSLDHYSVAPDGERIYAVASLGVEPQGIWEYHVVNRVLRRLVDGANSPFVVTRLVEPHEFRVKSFDGLEIPCFLFQSPGGASFSTSKSPPARRPVVIYLPPPTLQFQRSFQGESQLFANLGFHFVAVNYRGCDGYGRDYAALKSPADQARDVLAAYEELSKDPSVDTSNVFLLAVCGGEGTLQELLARSPQLWRAVALRHGVGAAFENLDPRKLPPILLTIGDHDLREGWRERFENWGRVNQVKTRLLIHPNSDHIGYNYKAGEQRIALASISEFFLEHLK